MSIPSKAPKAASSVARKVIFNAAAVAAHLGGLKKRAEAADQADDRWWATALAFDWTSLRKGNNNTQWGAVTYTDENSVSGRLTVRINGEFHTGQIMPASDAGVVELGKTVKNPNVKVEKRTKKAAIQFQKWSAQVKTAEDGVTLLRDGSGHPILPEDEKLSPYYQIASLVGEAFTSEAKERVDRGLALCAKAAEMKKAKKTITAQAVLDDFLDGQKPRAFGDVVLSSESVNGLRKLFPSDADVLTKGAILASNVKIVNLVQEHISDRAVKNAGCPLPNPMTRIAMNFDQTTGLAQLSFFDKNQPYQADGRQKYEVGKVDGTPIDADNVHLFVLSRSSIDGIINLDSICLSSMGISMPAKAEVVVVGRPQSHGLTLDDVYDEDGLRYNPDGQGAPAAAAEEPEDPSDLLDELAGNNNHV